MNHTATNPERQVYSCSTSLMNCPRLDRRAEEARLTEAKLSNFGYPACAALAHNKIRFLGMNAMRDSSFEFYGIAAIFGVEVVLILLLHQALGMPEVVQVIAQLNPRAGANARTLSWVLGGIVLLAAVAIPLILMSKDFKDGGSRLAVFGFLVWAVLVIPCVGYLVSIRWFSAMHLLWP